MHLSTTTAILLFAMALAGCTASSALFPYRVTNDDCDCDGFLARDPKADVSYWFTARYAVGEGIATRIEIDIRNGTSDTLDLSLAHVRISSRNVPYRYNNRFLPVTIPAVAPGREERLTLVGEVETLKTEDPWHSIAGEEVVATLKGMRIGGRALPPQVVRMIPHNPKLAN